ncbi:MAG: zf-HC2 domain-containing protein [Armatimonadetes bacterium]|nr:zf-HC2 domain-containing protein [Armatimonadota bacterium]
MKLNKPCEVNLNGPSITCEEVCELLYLYVMDELDEGETVSVSHHLSLCPSCRKAMAETVTFAGALSTVMPKVPLQYYSVNN